MQLALEVPEPALVRADPALLQLVLRNLLENALRHTESGTITCRLRGSVLEVVDQGPGFAPWTTCPRVFDRFYRRGPGSGHGLGLALVAHVCRACGWVPAAASGPDGGAVLSVDLGASLRGRHRLPPPESFCRPGAALPLPAGGGAPAPPARGRAGPFPHTFFHFPHQSLTGRRLKLRPISLIRLPLHGRIHSRPRSGRNPSGLILAGLTLVKPTAWPSPSGSTRARARA